MRTISFKNHSLWHRFVANRSKVVLVVPLVVDVDVVVLDIAVVEVVAVFILLSTDNAGRTKL